LRLAVISDVHANRLALEAVLEDISRARCDRIVCLGDNVSGPLDPAGTAERLISLDCLTLAGNHDRWLVERDDAALDPVDRFARARLIPAHLDWLTRLPATAVLEDVFLCHGTPRSDSENWLDAWFHDRQTTLPSEEAVTSHAAGIAQPVMLCGHTHIARMVRLRDGRIVVNPGAVGVQMVHGAPDARYAVLERRGGTWSVELRTVPYDFHAAARMARDNGFPAWHDVLAFGWDGPEGLF
jgi:diadenosine tetraphosphatase ApaH/serine/threonine PP2A family protein phosphatase